MNNFIFNLSGETPAKKNSRIINTKTGRSFPSKRYSEWHKNALQELKEQLQSEYMGDIKEGILPIKEPVKICLEFTHGDLRRRDSDNGCSSIMDLLTDSGILSDDNWQIVKLIEIENNYEKNNPSCNVAIIPLNKLP